MNVCWTRKKYQEEPVQGEKFQVGGRNDVGRTKDKMVLTLTERYKQPGNLRKKSVG